MSKSGSIYVNAEQKKCLYCNEIMNDLSGSWNEERRTHCRNKRPNCQTEHSNLKKSIEKSKKSKLVIVRVNAFWAEQMLEEGNVPKKVKSIYTFVNKRKNKVFDSKLILKDIDQTNES